jgi:hypothetical protein
MNAAPNKVIWVSKKIAIRLDGFKNKSTIKMNIAIESTKSSGSAAIKSV